MRSLQARVQDHQERIGVSGRTREEIAKPDEKDMQREDRKPWVGAMARTITCVVHLQ